MENQPLNQTFTAQPLPTEIREPAITMLAIPKSWSRLVLATVILLFIVVGLLTFIVYVQYRTSQDNVDRILDMQKEIEEIKARIPK